MEIANELIPSIVKSPSCQILNDPKCLAHILTFYDGLCSWEEGSPTPVLHIGWAKHMVATCSKFSAATRAGIQVEPEEVEEDEEEEEEEQTGKFYSDSPTSLLAPVEDNNNYYKTSKCDSDKEEPRRATICDNFNSQSVIDNDAKLNVRITKCQNNILIEKLSSSCANQLLNLDYLLGKANKPFLDASKKSKQKLIDRSANKNDNLKPKSISEQPDTVEHKAAEKVAVKFQSAKMRGLRGLICAEKLNTSAITLQLTAQSQTDVTSHNRKSTQPEEQQGSTRSKRPRRDT
jgi:menin